MNWLKRAWDRIVGRDLPSIVSVPIFTDAVIDVSHWNGAVDWLAVAGAGVKLAMIKATTGAGDADPAFATNLAGARAAGLAVCPYHWLTDEDPATQAANFLGATGAGPGDLVMLDWERSGSAASAATAAAVGALVVARTGRSPIGYWGIPGSSPAAPTPAMATWVRMVPRYRVGNLASFAALAAPLRSPGVPYSLWQYTETGRVPGVVGNVDRSVYAGTAAQLASFIAGA